MEQMYLDFGQRTFGRSVECKECGFRYTEGEATDEAAHRQHHRRVMQGVRVRGALAESVLLERDAGDRIVALNASDSAEALRKLVDVKALLDAELCMAPEPLAPHAKAVVLLEAQTGRVCGCAFAEPLRHANRVVPPDSPPAAPCTAVADAIVGGEEQHDDDDAVSTAGTGDCAAAVFRNGDSSGRRCDDDGGGDSGGGVLRHDGKEYEAMCGISHIWVEASRRRRGAARALLDAVRSHFATGFEIPRDRLAFSQPTALGRRLAASYAQREDFLVYE